ncbi:hypothetical protein [Paenibacillus mendelii]|uniref:Copper amine oxidase n=1 Tax=Paenibacillus mendelii TaxID=206163 RepID=A0ABV6JHW9_9BACL|nr:hypothetical protein [Paenibacillus mendelii]MCQ6558361.1 hypothetical protein [Paenibacillus mendelii]
MKDKTKGIIIGLAIGSMFAVTTAFADYGMKVFVDFKDINLFVDGSRKATTQVIIYEGTTYAPVRALSTAVGKPINADFTRNDLYLGKLPTNKGISLEKAKQLIKDKYKVPSGYTYSLDSLDEEGNYHIQVYEFVLDDRKTGVGHTATFGWYTVDKYTGNVTSMF